MSLFILQVAWKNNVAMGRKVAQLFSWIIEVQLLLTHYVPSIYQYVHFILMAWTVTELPITPLLNIFT
jgi:hypothetical protein